MWLYNDNPIDEESLSDYVAFVYIITNLVNGKRYIGKKLLKNRRTKTINGKKKKIVVDSDWKKYWGSNKILQQDVKELGEDKFRREILRLCKSKGDANYFEAKYQFDRSVLLSNMYYNDWIMCRISRSHMKKSLDDT